MVGAEAGVAEVVQADGGDEERPSFSEREPVPVTVRCMGRSTVRRASRMAEGSVMDGGIRVGEVVHRV